MVVQQIQISTTAGGGQLRQRKLRWQAPFGLRLFFRTRSETNHVLLPFLSERFRKVVAVDFSTLKDFRIRESHMLQVRFEAFNLPNHPNWGNPDTNVGQIQRDAAGNITNPGNFGVIGGTRVNMRNLQFALKYIF